MTLSFKDFYFLLLKSIPLPLSPTHSILTSLLEFTANSSKSVLPIQLISFYLHV